MNREEDMAGYAQQGTEEALPRIDTIDMLVTVTGVDIHGMAIFTLEGEFPKDKPYVSNATKMIRVPNGDVFLKYTLVDDTDNPKRKLDFCTGSPIWVTSQTSCPAAECSVTEIELRSVNKKHLIVIDHNGGAGDFRFSLVLDSDSGRVLADPIIRNEP